MEALILAAGLGSRLHPLTDHLPKALVKVQGTPLLQIAINRLQNAGVDHIVVNVHHFADLVEEFLLSQHWSARIDVSDERHQLLDTGGALKHAAHLFDGHSPVIVHNVDILSDIDLRAAASMHSLDHNLATLCASHRRSSRMLLFRNNPLVGRADNSLPIPPDCMALAFSGVSVVSQSLFNLLPPDTSPYPIIDQYITLANNHRIAAFVHPSDRWLDVGKPDTLNLAQSWSLS